jgi:hypothetical protein
VNEGQQLGNGDGKRGGDGVDENRNMMAEETATETLGIFVRKWRCILLLMGDGIGWCCDELLALEGSK